MKIALVAAGTAGHVNPMLSTFHELYKSISDTHPDQEIEFLFIGCNNGIEETLVPKDELVRKNNYELKLIEKVTMPRKISFKALTFPFRLNAAVKEATKILKDFEADIVVGFGGYASAPCYLAAKKLGLKVFIHEQNAKSGYANKLGAKYATGIGTTFESTATQLSSKSKAEFINVGIPVKNEIEQLANFNPIPAKKLLLRNMILSQFGFTDSSKPTLLVFGGSLGAKRINNTIADSIDKLVEIANVIVVTGNGKKSAFTKQINRKLDDDYEGRVTIFEYFDNFAKLLFVADLAICRAGAGSVSEVSILGVPTIFVPLPFGNGEQQLNATESVKAGGAKLVSDADFNLEYIETNVLPLLSDESELQLMSENIKKNAKHNAAKNFAEFIIKLTDSPTQIQDEIDPKENNYDFINLDDSEDLETLEDSEDDLVIKNLLESRALEIAKHLKNDYIETDEKEKTEAIDIDTISNDLEQIKNRANDLADTLTNGFPAISDENSPLDEFQTENISLDSTNTTSNNSLKLAPLPEISGPLYFIGIGGAGMSGIALCYKQLGYEVYGSDREESTKTEYLREQGIEIFVPQNKNNFKKLKKAPSTIVVTSAIKEGNSEYDKALKMQALGEVEIIHRSIALAKLSANKKLIAVAGSHGKSTTTGILHTILPNASYVIGAEIKVADFDLDKELTDHSHLVTSKLNPETTENDHIVPGGFYNKNSDAMIIEADESDKSFLEYSPSIVLINNIEQDHLVNYTDNEDLENTFVTFALRAKDTIIINGDSIITDTDTQTIPMITDTMDLENPSEISGEIERNVITKLRDILDGKNPAFANIKHNNPKLITFGRKKGNDYRLLTIPEDDYSPGYFEFRDNRGKIYTAQQNLKGTFNELNALGAIIAANISGAEMSTAIKLLPRFKGVSRRFEIHKVKTTVENLSNNTIDLTAAPGSDSVDSFAVSDGFKSVGGFDFAGGLEEENLPASSGYVTYIDDYAHHPTELRSAIETAKKMLHADARLIVLFQPHLYSRTIDFKDDFARALSLADEVIVTGIYAAREVEVPGIDSTTIVKSAEQLPNNTQGKFTAIEDRFEAFDETVKRAKPGDIVMFLGAGNIGEQAREFFAKN
jgi:UDP-N-acetylglucosamine--N-acetylmuramyl-(pentapeptide) pyrophosphoryl-undecaprenol N-acetylglucosamine transferase